MDHCELEELVDCILCGCDVSLGRDCAYAIGEASVLCFSCAVCRGGIYDEVNHTWTKLPDVTGLQGRERSERVLHRRYWAYAAHRA